LRKLQRSPSAASVEALSEVLSPAERAHIASCEKCRGAAWDLLTTREIFEGVGSTTEMARPWFATRVMAGIVARERKTGRGGEYVDGRAEVCFAVSSGFGRTFACGKYVAL